MKERAAIGAAVFLFALLLGFATAGVRGSLDRPVQGDGVFFIGLARSLAAGKGYVLERSPWPNAPDLGRLPVWPAMLVLPCAAFPHANDNAILRVSAIVVNAAAAVLLAVLTYSLWPNPIAALLAGAIFAVYPTELGLVENGLSEPSFFLLAFGGAILLLRGGGKAIAGAALLGVSVLVRSNMLIFPAVALLAAMVHRPLRCGSLKQFAILTIAFVIPPAAWMARNYLVAGAFPMVNAMEGETLYGGNNIVSATQVDAWGDWVFPDLIPGETPKKQLGSEMSEAALNRFYERQAIGFFLANWRGYPRLLLGKLIRAFVPVPWRPSWSEYVIAAARILLLVGLVLALASGPPRNARYELLVTSMFLVTFVTTVGFYGSSRFTFSLEAFLIPYVAIAVARGFPAPFSRVRKISKTAG